MFSLGELLKTVGTKISLHLSQTGRMYLFFRIDPYLMDTIHYLNYVKIKVALMHIAAS